MCVVVSRSRKGPRRRRWRPRAGARAARALALDPAATDVAAIKAIESRIKHDVKAVEFWIRGELQMRGASAAQLEWVHFACTSEDINNLAYALMLKGARDAVVLPALDAIGALLDSLAHRYAAIGMLARTHGQTATPTSVGKEVANVAARLKGQRTGLARVAILGKINGAVGNFNAHVAAFPPSIGPPSPLSSSSRSVCSRIPTRRRLNPTTGLPSIVTRSPGQYRASRLRARYVELYFAGLLHAKARGRRSRFLRPCRTRSIPSTSRMPRAIWGWRTPCSLISRKAAGLTLAARPDRLDRAAQSRRCGRPLRLAYQSLAAGLQKIELDEARLAEDLGRAWEVLAEAVQTVMRAHGLPDAYDRLKEFTRGRPWTRRRCASSSARCRCRPTRRTAAGSSPKTYLGLAPALARRLSP